jgi:hypothetical protein
MTATVRNGEAAVEARSAALKRELGVTDLVFTQILFIVGLPWVVQVESRLLFALKILALIVAANAAGVAIFLGRIRRRGAHRDDL